jgi:hypothetical protein
MDPGQPHVCEPSPAYGSAPAVAPASVQRPFRVLALDGGGVRGYYTVRLLARLLERAGGDPAACDVGRAFDLLVGTSTGSIVAAGLAVGTPLPRLAALYREQCATIFPSPSPPGWTNLFWCGRHWRRASGSAEALRRALRETLGDATLGEVAARRGIALAITVTDLWRARGRVLATPRHGHDGDASLALVDACAASCAAPMLLPPERLDRADLADSLWCDGGLWATSPLAVALEQALARAASGQAIELLSLGTCAMPVPAAVIARLPGTGIGLWIRALRAVQVSADAQARAIVVHVEALAPHLRRPVDVLRVLDPAATDAEAAEVRLDNPSPAAWSAMDALAERATVQNLDDDAGAPPGHAARLRTLLEDVVASGSAASSAGSGEHR